MLPIRDHNPSTRKPLVVWSLIAANSLVFLITLGISSDDRALMGFYDLYAMIPARISFGEGYYTLFTSMFLHGGLLHLGGNLLFLWIFGDNMEDQMGHLPFLTFYLACGVGAALAEYAAGPGSPHPVVGASGAIAGVMGGYLLLFPRARVDVLVFLLFIIRVFQVPAWVMLALWFGLEFLSGLGTVSADVGVAHWAHAGGFAVGAVLTLPLWIRRGRWRTTGGRPPHAPRQDRFSRTNVPRVGRR